MEPGIEVRLVSAAPTAYSSILQGQRAWAAARAISVDRRAYTAALEDNLCQPLHPLTRAEFAAGKGEELGRDGVPGKMQSLISSSALACNIFDPWRDQGVGALGRALRIGPSYQVGRFEATHPTGLLGTPPHLDVELNAPGKPVVGIESKFTEPYRKVKNAFRSSYFEAAAVWTQMPRALDLAGRVVDTSESFQHLHVAQLIKHALGLMRSYGSGGFTLYYIWYRPNGPEGDRHADEIDRFQGLIEGEFDFRHRSYQELLLSLNDGPLGWLEYVRGRYLNVDHPIV
jgi:hypothetical protein